MSHQYAKYLLNVSATIGDALVAITENKRGAVLIVDTDNTLMGVVSDGDIRRALVKGATTLTPIGKIINPNVASVHQAVNQAAEGEKIFSSQSAINLLPVLDSANRVRNVLVRG